MGKKSGMIFGLGTRLGVTKQMCCKTGEIPQVTEQKCLLTEKTSRMTRQATGAMMRQTGVQPLPKSATKIGPGFRDVWLFTDLFDLNC